jgi:hypothetical protein
MASYVTSISFLCFYEAGDEAYYQLGTEIFIPDLVEGGEENCYRPCDSTAFPEPRHRPLRDRPT